MNKYAIQSRWRSYDKCWAALDFHHKDLKTKEFVVAQLLEGKALNAKNIKKLFKEIDKRVVLCANRHRELHY